VATSNTVSLLNGTRSLIPAGWTDWNMESAGSGANSPISHDLGRLGDLLLLRKIQRSPQPAL
jgi:hypothetical protein